ncbi:MAG: type II secretion system protein, partial [Verrucomicrobia bacterium]|nr:type II secretion system protein [Verrucomicrobiota bacterium]
MRRVDFSARNRGFTLIEIVLVIAIGVVFMGGRVSSFHGGGQGAGESP